VALLAVAAVWGATFVMVKDALVFAGPFAFVAVRFTLATLLMAPLLLAERRRGARNGCVFGAGLVAGVALFAGYGFQTAGLQFTTPARAAFLTGLSVVIVPLLTAWVLRQPVPRGGWVGVALAVVGLALLSLGPDLLAVLRPARAARPLLLAAETAWGDLLVLACALAFAAHIVLVGRFAPRYGTLPLTAAQLFAAALLGIVFAAAFEQPAAWQLGAILPAAAFTGVFATVLAFTIQVRAQRFTTPTHTALIFSTEPVFGALFAYLLAGEVLAPPALAGCLLILAGMVVAQLAEQRPVT
jgi:drug/metabolite transporter (DMT)-like permease